MPGSNPPTSTASRPPAKTPVTVAHYLGLTPKWVDGTAVGGCSFMIHVRHAAAAIVSGLCETVLITHGESGRSGVGRTRNVVAPTSLAGQFEQPYGPMGPPTLFTIPVLRYMKTYGLSHEQLALVSVAQREWAAKNPRATFKQGSALPWSMKVRFAADSPLEGDGFELPVPRHKSREFPQHSGRRLVCGLKCRPSLEVGFAASSREEPASRVVARRRSRG
jgi:acetyl-CoA acetyltransferase